MMKRQTPDPVVHALASAGDPSLAPREARMRWLLALLLLASAAVLCLGWLPQARGQEASLAEPEQTLDIEALLRNERVLAEQIETPVWRIEPNPGRRLVALPLRITPREEATELPTSPTISLRGGRFLFWMIELEQETTGRQRQPRTGRPGPPSQMDRREAEVERPSLPEDAPQLARRVTVKPDGRVQWRLERAIPNGTLRDAEIPYVLRIRPDRLRDLQPERPSRTSTRGNQDRRAQAAQRREADRQYLEERRAFAEMRREIMALPDEFEVAGVARVWAVFEISSTLGELDMTGDAPLLPWSIRMNDLLAVRSFAGASRGRNTGDSQQEQMLRLGRLAANGHELTHRLLAHAAIDAGVISDMELNDATYGLIQSLIRSDDEIARQTVMSEVVSVTPANPATMTLLRLGAAHPDPGMKLIALRGLVQADAQDPEQLTQMLGSTSALLADPTGPDPALVLTELSEAIGDRADAIVQVSANLPLERLPTDRLHAAVDHIISVAGEQPLAAALLDRQLLGSANPNLVQHTLERIVSADTRAPWLRETAHAGLGLLFGPPEPNADDTVGPLAMSERIPIDSPRHALFRSLNSGHEQIRESAWQSLRNFRFNGDAPAPRNRRSSTDAAEQVEDFDEYEALVEAALSRSQTPAQVVPFLSRQPNGRRASAAMLRLVLSADDAVAEQAGQALLGSERPVAEALAGMSDADRERVVGRLYERLTGTSPRVVGLLREQASERRGATVHAWLGQRIAEGSLPAPGEWIEPFRDEDQLLGLAGSSDPEVADGAVAALVYAAGGDEIAVNEQLERFEQLRGADRADLQAAWISARRDIYARRMSDAQGSYRLVVLVYQSERASASPRDRDPRRAADRRPADAAEGATERMAQRIMLGVVDLVADGRSVRFSNDIVPLALAAESRLAIRIERVHELNNFRNEELAELPLEEMREPLDLVPQPDGAWVGSAPLNGGGRLELRMEPVQ